MTPLFPPPQLSPITGSTTQCFRTHYFSHHPVSDQYDSSSSFPLNCCTFSSHCLVRVFPCRRPSLHISCNMVRWRLACHCIRLNIIKFLKLNKELMYLSNGILFMGLYIWIFIFVWFIQWINYFCVNNYTCVIRCHYLMHVNSGRSLEMKFLNVSFIKRCGILDDEVTECQERLAFIPHHIPATNILTTPAPPSPQDDAQMCPQQSTPASQITSPF